MANEKKYLGDGVYGEDVGQMIKTWTQRETGIHEIYYEPSVLWSFLVWLRRIGWLNDEMLEKLRAQPTPEERKEDDLAGLEGGDDGEG